MFSYATTWRISNVKLDAGELLSFAVYTRIANMLQDLPRDARKARFFHCRAPQISIVTERRHRPEQIKC